MQQKADFRLCLEGGIPYFTFRHRRQVMTEENYEYRTSQIMLRNELPGDGKWSIPIIPKFQIRDGDFDDLLLNRL